MLFGKEIVDDQGNATGERDSSGFFSAELTKFLTKDLKGIAGAGLTGAMTALIPGIPGGPIAGLMVGSAIGFVNRNGAITEYLFGDEQKEGGLVRKFRIILRKLHQKHLLVEYLEHLLVHLDLFLILCSVVL